MHGQPTHTDLHTCTGMGQASASIGLVDVEEWESCAYLMLVRMRMTKKVIPTATITSAMPMLDIQAASIQPTSCSCVVGSIESGDVAPLVV